MIELKLSARVTAKLYETTGEYPYTFLFFVDGIENPKREQFKKGHRIDLMFKILHVTTRRLENEG